MKSGKQPRAAIMARRKKLAVKRHAVVKEQERRFRPTLGVPVNEELLAPNNSYGAPDFVRRGYYVEHSVSLHRLRQRGNLDRNTAKMVV